MTTEDKLIKTFMDASLTMAIATGIGYVGKKMMKESFTSDPSNSIINYGKWVVVLAGSFALKDYLETKKILPKSV